MVRGCARAVLGRRDPTCSVATCSEWTDLDSTFFLEMNTMPNYNAQNPPYSIFPDDVALAFNSEAPAAVTIQLQTAMNDVDAQYAILTGAANMTTSLTAGDNLVASGVRANFVRAKVTSITGGSGVTVQILG